MRGKQPGFQRQTGPGEKEVISAEDLQRSGRTWDATPDFGLGDLWSSYLHLARPEKPANGGLVRVPECLFIALAHPHGCPHACREEEILAFGHETGLLQTKNLIEFNLKNSSDQSISFPKAIFPPPFP